MKRSLFHTAATMALFAGALLASLRANGTSPIVWSDTFNDEIAVQRCVADQGCTLSGIGTSIPGLLHAVGWLQLRSLLAWCGLGLDGVHILLQILNALAVAILYHVATQLGGPLAGILAVWLLVAQIGTLSVQHAAIYNSTPLPFLGTVLLIACLAAARHPGVTTLALAALVSAVLANVHAACILAGASVVRVACLAPQHRWRLAIFAGLVFAGATFIIGPLGWLHDVARLSQSVETSGTPRSLDGHASPLIFWSLFALAGWAFGYRDRLEWARMRTPLQGSFAVLVPMLASCVIAPCFGIEASAKYLAHVGPAAALAAALPLALLVHRVTARIADSGPFRPIDLSAIGRVLPFVLALLMPLTVTVADEAIPRTGDIAAAARLLQQRGWDRQHVIEGLKTVQAMTVLTGVSQLLAPDTERNAYPSRDGESALLLTVDRATLPTPLRSDWTLLRASGRTASVLIITHSRLDWSRFAVCVDRHGTATPPCRDSGLRFVPNAVAFSAPNMPIGGPRGQGKLTIHVPLRTGDTDEAIFMPRMGGLCGGIIVSSGSDMHVDAEHRRATLSPTSGPTTITFEWNVGSPECSEHSYDGLPPFIVAGDPDTVQTIETMFHRNEMGS